MIDAACQAIKAATGIDGKLTDFNVSSVTGGVDALGDVIVQVEADGIRVSGRGVSTDVVEASARAYLVGGQQDRPGAGARRGPPHRGRPLTGGGTVGRG